MSQQQAFVRMMVGTPETDLPNRILRRAHIMSNRLATDGWIIEPTGVDVSLFVTNPIVQAKHGKVEDLHSPVIGRSLSVQLVADGWDSETQFADTELGREYGYLYGLNPKGEVYMRAWSFSCDVLQRESLSLGAAQRLLGAGWDPDLAAKVTAKGTPIQRATRTLMKEYSCVPLGADRAALSRAYADGVSAAGAMLADLDLGDAARELQDLRARLAGVTAQLSTFQGELETRLSRYEQELQALRRDGAAAAARGDSAELLAGLRALQIEVRTK